jgi:hypothetical protein
MIVIFNQDTGDYVYLVEWKIGRITQARSLQLDLFQQSFLTTPTASKSAATDLQRRRRLLIT